MTTAPLEPEPGEAWPETDEPDGDPSVLPNDTPEPDPGDDTIEAPIGE